MDPASDITKEIVLDSHETNFLRRMNALRKATPEESFCDVSFNIDGEQFPCHKLVLITASTYFKNMFNGDYRETYSCKNITMQGIEPEALEAILTAIYTSRLQLNRLNAFFILQASHMLDLTDIFEATELRIIEDTDIDYLIDTCAFARKLDRNDLYRKCISAIASDLKNQSKTNAFLKEEGKAAIMTFDIFQDVLSNENLIADDEALYQIITKWCYFEKCSMEVVLSLLNTVDINSGCLSEQTLARTIVLNYNNSEFGQITSIATSTSGSGSNKRKSGKGKLVEYNVYLNTLDIETGAKGWAHLQSQNEFEDFKVIHYEHSNSAYRKVKQIGKQLYCFEFDYKLKREFFYHLETGEKTYLNLPPAPLKSRYFDIEAVANSIYLITEHEELWKYDLETGNWTKVSIKTTSQNAYGLLFDDDAFPIPIAYRIEGGRRVFTYHPQEAQDRIRNQIMKKPKKPFGDSISSCPVLASDGGTLYIAGLSDWDIVQLVPNQPVSSQNRIGYLHKAANPAVCCYEHHVVVTGSNHDGNLHKDVSVYNIWANKWDTLKNMNTARANHTLTHHDGFLYAIENREEVWNEKYDTRNDRWIDFSPLPERFSVMQNQKRIELATCNVFNCSIKK